MSKKGNKIIKSVSFNVTNPDDVAMLDVIKRRNFSGYVKSLIKDDIKHRGMVETFREPNEAAKNDTKKESAAERLERLKRNTKRPGTTGRY